MTAEDLEGLLNKKILGVGYEETFHGCYLVVIIKNHEYYLRSDTPIELELRDIH